MLNIVIFGAPGSGKGTQSDLIIKEYGVAHISTGDALRAHIKGDTELGKTAKEYIDRGQLVPDELVVGILAHELDALPAGTPGVIFDGFPRDIEQAETLDAMLAERGEKVDTVIGLEVHDDELVKRIIERGKVSGRSDDNEETARQRLATYHAQTQPLRDFYIRQGKYASIQGEGSIADIFAAIKTSIDALRQK